ncbi:hypothetical protein SNK05_004382 [Fusarium graminearum]
MTEREYEGVTQSLEYLRSLKDNGRLPSLTVIVTNWDLVPPILSQKYRDKLAELRDTSWKDFTDHGYIEFGFDYDHYPAESREATRAEVVTQLVDRYTGAEVVPVKMPFWEWTWGEIANGIAQCVGMALIYVGMAVTSPVWAPLAVFKQEFEKGNIVIGVTTDGNLYMRPADQQNFGNRRWDGSRGGW